MCDTVLAKSSATATGSTLFGKNSDRQRNEAQAVELFAAADHSSGASVRCTYISIPQVAHTHAVLLCRPFWMWGAEMGANEQGVVIGNEGLHTRVGGPRDPALTGMDLLRLALERADSARHAVDIITTLLEEFGQGGNCGHLTPQYYNNGFMIADATEAFVLETVEKEWLVQPIHGVRSMSNRYSIERSTRVSQGLIRLIQARNWGEPGQSGYAASLANPDREHLGNAGARSARTTSLLMSLYGHIEVADMMRILRDHAGSSSASPDWHAACEVERTICMHAGAENRDGQTTGSLVSELHSQNSVHWVTGTAATCMSIFKPVLLELPLPSQGPRPTDKFDTSALWWRHERLHRSAILGDFAEFLKRISSERDSLEADFRKRVREVLAGGSIADRARVIEECWSNAHETEESWYARLAGTRSAQRTPRTAAWEKMSQAADLKVKQAGNA